MPKIFFELQSITVECKSGDELTKIYDSQNGLPLKFGCRRGNCGVCAIYIVEGHENLTKMSKEEKETLRKKGLGENSRLGCQCTLNGSITIRNDPSK